MSDGLCYCGEPGTPGHPPHPDRPDGLDKLLAKYKQAVTWWLKCSQARKAAYLAHADSPEPDVGRRYLEAQRVLMAASAEMALALSDINQCISDWAQDGITWE